MKLVAMTLNTSLSGWSAACFASLATVGRHARIRPASEVDLSRYMGSWRIIACTDNKLERDFVDAAETYQVCGNGRIAVRFAWRKNSFNAPVSTHNFTGRVEAGGTNARWKMQLFPLFTVSYIIAKVSPDYTRAAVAHPSRKFGWILARERTLSAQHYQEMLAALERQGYDTSQFIQVPQIRGA
jgi:apolipoprotein D and lipocalin family protein